MIAKPYDRVMLFMGVLSVRGFPDSLKEKLEERYGIISMITEPFPFSFTDYYVPEMGNGIERFFLAFDRLILPDELAAIKTETDRLEEGYAIDGNRKINLDPGIITEGNIILATTKNRAHRIAIGQALYAEVTLMYHSHGFESFPWTYADYRSDKVQSVLLSFRKRYLSLRKLSK